MQKIRLSADWETWPFGKRVQFAKGDYDVPSQMSELIADRAVRSGFGKRIQADEAVDSHKRAPRNKGRGAAPENKSLGS